MTYTVTDVLNTIIGAFTDLLGYIASAISANAENLANILVMGLVFGVSAGILMKFGRSIWTAITGFARAFRI